MKTLNSRIVLSTAVSALMTMMVCSSVSQASDIEIYSNATGGKTTITLMLDTSGSMSESQVGASACELSGSTSYTPGSETSSTTPSYTRYYCGVAIPGSSSQRVYYYKRTGPSGNRVYYKCGSGSNGSTNANACTIQLSYTPDRAGLNDDDFGGARYYYKNEYPQIKHYDRLTRLKDAIFTLMDSNQIDSNSVAMGIGQFSSQSGSDNVFTSADGRSGKIVVPAALLSTTQRTAIKTAVANLQGGGGTPTANAYAEVAAYMLGETTATGSSNNQMYFLLTGGNAGNYAVCRQWSGTTCTSWDGFYYQSGFTPSGYTAGTTGSLGGYAGRYYLGEKFDRGFAKSVTTSKSGAKYISPLSTTNTQCNGQGIYFLTDGNPNSSNDPVSVMQKALGSTGSSFSVPTTGTLPDGSESGHGMPAVGEFAKALRNQRASSTAPNRNPLGLEIKTAVVGFGSVFNVDRTADAAKPVADRIIRTLDYINSRGERTNEQRDYYNCSLITNVNAQNACNWGAKPHPDLPSSVGGYGNGGFYSAQSTEDVVQSVVKFLDDVKPEFEPIATGSPTLPQDALNPLRIQPYGYYGSFTPKPQESTQLWVGNMNKYHIFNGELYNASKTIRLIKADGSLNAAAKGLWTDEGMKGQLPLGLATNESGDQFTKRTIYTNREISDTAPYIASASDELKKVNVTSLFGTGTSALFANDPDKNYWLNLLGYNVGATETVTLADLITKPELRQLGAVMHSTPILLTQSGKVKVVSGVLDTTDRDDYLLFGTTQGLLHVVKAGKNSTDADRGKEVFTFVPHEMMEKQKTAFLTEDSTTGGSANLFYGIDAPWVAHTQYVAKSDGTLTVNLSGRTVKESDDADEIALKGLQWVYGGLRMGGRSYYALDLSDIDDPSLKFHINPDAAASGTALSYMGQSWSKPTIAYVNFGGVKKLVMFVGGGYDATGATTACNATGETAAKNIGYECAQYNQSNGKGAGVYMFDAMNGSLLWWASSNASSSDNKGAEASTPKAELQYSVVSQINAIDRDSDGLVDHLYFGDLGGQAFRVDLNNGASAKSNFATRVQRLYNGHVNTGLSPRFYEMPSFSIHDGVNGAFGVLALSSGNRSSPLAGTTGANASGVGSANDAVFVIYDNDVARNDLYTTTSLNTANVTLGNWSVAGVAQTTGTGASTAYNGGWKYTYSTTAGRYKGLNELYALDNMLYVNVFDRDGTGIGGTCGAGIKGDSYVYQFCLPTGKCPENFYASGQTAPNSVKIGAGILGAGLGTGYNNVSSNSSLVVNRNGTDCTIPANKNKPQCQLFDTSAKLKQLRWYESR